MQTLNIEFIDVTEDSLTAKMPVNSSVHQPYGLLHGGATAALAETVGSCASALFVDTETHIIKGIELSINHLKSVKKVWFMELPSKFTKVKRFICGKLRFLMMSSI